MLTVNESAQSDGCDPSISGQGREILGIMAKYWTSGKVKTRLGAAIGNTASASLHRQFMVHLCRQLDANGDHREVVVTPASAIPWIRPHLSDRWNFRPQADGDLGDRMRAWFRETFYSDRFDRAVLIGADCPRLTSSDIRTSFELLQHDQIVLGPASDGGYYLIGLQKTPSLETFQRLTDCLFTDITWSRDDVFDITQRRISDFGWSLGLLPQKSDVDELDDLQRLCDELKMSRAIAPSDGELADAISQLMEHFDAESAR